MYLLHSIYIEQVSIFTNGKINGQLQKEQIDDFYKKKDNKKLNMRIN